jgi:plasmid stabilization system protein ParE
MAFRVSVSAKAKRDLDGILAWLLAEEAGETGLRWFQGLKNALASLANLPERCPLAPENRSFSFEVRQLLYGHKPHTYRILFTIEADTVTILHVRHGRRRRLSH